MDSLKQELKSLKESAVNNEQLQKLLQEKEDSIRGLLEEGEKLSKQQMDQQKNGHFLSNNYMISNKI